MTPVLGSIVTPSGSPLAAYVSVSPSASVACGCRLTAPPSVTVRSVRSVVNTGAAFVSLTTRVVLADVPLCVASDGVTVTLMLSPSSPLPAWERSNVSVSAVGLVNVRRSVPLTRHSQVRLTASASGSVLVAVAVRTVSVTALPGVSWTVALGAVLLPAMDVLPESVKLKPATGKNSKS